MKLLHRFYEILAEIIKKIRQINLSFNAKKSSPAIVRCMHMAFLQNDLNKFADQQVRNMIDHTGKDESQEAKIFRLCYASE